mmetsp:Transcript_54187/g.117075  ORF Transcript_54187/g.117075 Transcript_54187/m.117075 type:complete len:518 (-) Transcript_54187:76-1629(-)
MGSYGNSKLRSRSLPALLLACLGAVLFHASLRGLAEGLAWSALARASALSAPLAPRSLRSSSPQEARSLSVARRMNLLEMLEDAAGTPVPQAPENPIPSAPLDAEMLRGELFAYVLEEKAMSMSGEDFEVKSPTGEVLLRIGGGNRLPIPGMPVWDKLSISSASGAQVATLDRQPVAMTTTYDINRADGSKFGKISRAMFAFTPTFELWEEGDSSAPLLKAEGSFSERNYAFKSRKGEVVATVVRLKGFTSGDVDNYQVVVGPKVDASLVLAMAVVIDEVHDEENKSENTEDLMDKMEDASGLPMPQAASPPIPSHMPALDPDLLFPATTAYELEEKALSMSGEDFDVKSPTGSLVLRIGGGNRIPISGMPVWDKLTVSSPSGALVATLDREMIAMTPTYDVFRADGQKFGKISKAMFSLGEAFELFLEGDGAGGPALRAEGTFSERRYTFKSREGVVVAAVGRGYFQSDNENRYHIVVGPQVDASLVVAMAVAIDEVHDEEAKEEGGESEGGFPFR